jgi:hypothetical protein
MNSLKATVPVLVCCGVLLYCCWNIYRRNAGVYVSQEYNVEIIVRGPDGKIIPAVRRAPPPSASRSSLPVGGGIGLP